MTNFDNGEPIAHDSAAPPPAETALRRRWILATAAAGAVALFSVPLLLTGAGSRPNATLPPPGGSTCKAEGAANFTFTVKDPTGAAKKLAEYKGKVILLNFWGTWCPPCRAEIPALMELQAKYGNQGFVVVGVAVEDTAEAVRAYAAETKINYPLIMSQEDVEDAYGPVYGLPISLFIGRDGSICKKHLGPITKESAEREIKSLL